MNAKSVRREARPLEPSGYALRRSKKGKKVTVDNKTNRDYFRKAS